MTSPFPMQRLGAQFLTTALFAAALAACGGSDEPVLSLPTISTQPQSVTIAEGGQGTVTVEANSDTASGPIAYQWFNVSGNANIAGATAASYAFGPLSLVAHGTQYNVRVANNVGTTTSSTGTLSVTERSWAPQAAALSAGARQLASVVDSNGHTHLLAITGNNLAAAVEARVKLKSTDSTQSNAFVAPGNAVLQASEALGVGTNSTSISAAANGNGYVMATWHRNGIVGGALYTPGPNATTPGSWTLLPTRVNSFTSNSVSDPAVTADGSNGFEFVWRERAGTSGAHDVVARHYTIDNNTLGTVTAIESSSAETGAPRVASDAAGNVLAAWHLAGTGVVVNRRAAGASWGTTTTAVGSGLPLETLKAAGNGKAVLLASDRLGSVHAAQLDLGSSTPLTAAAQGVANAYGSAPDAHIDANGKIWVFGVSVNTSANNTSTLFQWTFVPGTGWSAPQAMSAVNTGNFIGTGVGVYAPKVAGADAEGNLMLTWQDRVSSGDSPLSHVSARRFHAGLNAWRSTVAVGDGGNGPVATTIGAEGNATVVFQGTGTTVEAASFR